MVTETWLYNSLFLLYFNELKMSIKIKNKMEKWKMKLQKKKFYLNIMHH